MTKVDNIDYNLLSHFFEKVKGLDVVQNSLFSEVKIARLRRKKRINNTKMMKYLRRINGPLFRKF